MGWNSMSFPFGSLLTAAKMTQVFSNFASLAYQESGAPQLGGLGNISVGSGLSIPGVGSLGALNVAGHAQAGAGFASPGVSSFDQLNVGSYGHVHAFSGVAAPGVSSFDQLNVGSLNILGNRSRQLLQRVVLLSATSRGTTSAVYSTYAVASITPVSSLSQILVQAGIYGSAINGTLGGLITSHLMRNPAGAVTSFAYLTNSAIAVNSVGAQPMGTIGVLIANVSIQGMAAFVAADSAINVDPKQYGVDWNYVFGNVQGAITGGYVTVEEWL